MRSLILSVAFTFSLALVASPLLAEPTVDAPLKAADFTLKAADGSNYRLAEQRGELVLINFWASWCGPCRQEMPELDKLAADFADLGVQVVGINVEQETADAEQFLKAAPVSFPILWDGSNSTAKAYAVSGMPTTVIVDRNGDIRYRHAGYQPGDEQQYREQLKKLVRE